LTELQLKESIAILSGKLVVQQFQRVYILCEIQPNVD